MVINDQHLSAPVLSELAEEWISTLPASSRFFDLHTTWTELLNANTASKQFVWTRKYARDLCVYARGLEMMVDEAGDPE